MGNLATLAPVTTMKALSSSGNASLNAEESRIYVVIDIGPPELHRLRILKFISLLEFTTGLGGKAHYVDMLSDLKLLQKFCFQTKRRIIRLCLYSHAISVSRWTRSKKCLLTDITDIIDVINVFQFRIFLDRKTLTFTARITELNY